ncbi:hypothetical protein Tco_0524809 [Tanacetum coccineum]
MCLVTRSATQKGAWDLLPNKKGGGCFVVNNTTKGLGWFGLRGEWPEGPIHHTRSLVLRLEALGEFPVGGQLPTSRVDGFRGTKKVASDWGLIEKSGQPRETWNGYAPPHQVAVVEPTPIQPGPTAR